MSTSTKSGGSGTAPPDGFKNWTDYTRFALEAISVNGPVAPSVSDIQARGGRPFAMVDRKRALGIDFGPKFTGLALSLGGVNTMPMGTLNTGEDWKQTALKITQIASTRRIKDIVVGQPLEKDGKEGRIAKLVRHFAQILADATLLTLGGNVTVYLWDERFSTTYAAMRLVSKPNFDGASFKTWLDGQKGLSYNAKALLDAEAARAILEHFLSKDPVTDAINKEKAERVSPSREACVAYLKWRKRPLLKPKRPTEPAGPGKEGWEWSDAHPESYETDPEELMRMSDDFQKYMDGSDRWGSKGYENWKRRNDKRREESIERRLKKLQDETGLKEAMRAATSKNSVGTGSGVEPWGGKSVW